METPRSGDDQNQVCLLKLGANVNSLDEHGRTVLIYVSQSGRTKCVNVFTVAEADVNILKDYYPSTTLASLMSKEVKYGNQLIFNKTKFKTISSVLHYAFQSLNENVVNLIIQAGADVNSKPYFFRNTTVLIESAKRG